MTDLMSPADPPLEIIIKAPRRITPARDSELMRHHETDLTRKPTEGFRKIARRVAQQIAKELDLR
jgi:hypothetical protein